MKYKLINEINEDYDALAQVLTNRGIKYEDIPQYLDLREGVVLAPSALGEKLLKAAARNLLSAINSNSKALIIVDSDCDGYTSSALLINYLHELFPSWVENNLDWFMHSGKQHGLSDCIDKALTYDIILIPDAGSNDFQYHAALAEANIPVLIFDHHEVEEEINTEEYENAIIINNQTCDYSNKYLSGVGVTWQFCRYLDELNNTEYANKFLDLVALGNCGDMMSLLSLETKYLINTGFLEKNLKNPFIYGMAKKNAFKLGDTITPMGAAFYIVPFVNAMVRSGTQEEKEVLFCSMLTHMAFKEIPSTKRGHKLGEMEDYVTQALRVVTNVKNRQTKAQDSGMEMLENLIEKNKMMDHGVLLFLLDPGKIDRNIAGLCANKIMAKYQHPCCILTKVTDNNDISYQGSARGCDKVGITEFKDICAATGSTMYTAGHQGAFGLGIEVDKIDDFIEATDEALKDMPNEPLYYVDYIYNNYEVKGDDILSIAAHPELWGQQVDEPLVLIKNLKLTNDMVTIYRKKTNTLKITLPNKIALIKFMINEELENLLSNIEGYLELDIVGYCRANEWNGNVSPQIEIVDFEVLDKCKYYF